MDFVGARRVMLMMGHAGNGVSLPFSSFLFFTWLGYRHILDKSILKMRLRTFLYKGTINPLPKGGISNIITY